MSCHMTTCQSSIDILIDTRGVNRLTSIQGAYTGSHDINGYKGFYHYQGCVHTLIDIWGVYRLLSVQGSCTGS